MTSSSSLALVFAAQTLVHRADLELQPPLLPSQPPQGLGKGASYSNMSTSPCEPVGYPVPRSPIRARTQILVDVFCYLDKLRSNRRVVEGKVMLDFPLVYLGCVSPRRCDESPSIHSAYTGPYLRDLAHTSASDTTNAILTSAITEKNH